MGFFAERKLNKAQELAQMQYAEKVTAWETDRALLEKMELIFTNAKNGIDSISVVAVNEPGEIMLWSADATFHETRRGASTFVGGSSGFSIPVVAGIRFRTGAVRGTSIPGDNSQADLDNGRAIVTTTRILFVGPMYSKEWALSKIISIASYGDGSDFIINVSNREKSSGIRVNANEGNELNHILALAITAAESGISEVLSELAKLRTEITTTKPVLELPMRSD